MPSSVPAVVGRPRHEVLTLTFGSIIVDVISIQTLNNSLWPGVSAPVRHRDFARLETFPGDDYSTKTLLLNGRSFQVNCWIPSNNLLVNFLK